MVSVLQTPVSPVDQRHLRFQWRRRGREFLTALEPLVASPQDLATPLRMPAGARLAISHSAGLAAGSVQVSLGSGVTSSHPALDAGQVHELALYAREGSVVSVAGAPSGTLTLYALNPFDHAKRLAIGTGVVA